MSGLPGSIRSTSSRFGYRTSTTHGPVFISCALQNDHRVIAVDGRGMGASGHPGDVEGSSSLGDFVGDLVCALTHAGVAGKPICIGFVTVLPRIGSPRDTDPLCCSSHDWGGSICWEAGRSRPDIFSGVVSLALPVSRPLLPKFTVSDSPKH